MQFLQNLMGNESQKAIKIVKRADVKNKGNVVFNAMPQSAQSIFRNLQGALVTLCREHGFEIEVNIVDKTQAVQ